MIGRRLCVRYETQVALKQGINVGLMIQFPYISVCHVDLVIMGRCYVAVLMEGKRFF